MAGSGYRRFARSRLYEYILVVMRSYYCRTWLFNISTVISPQTRLGQRGNVMRCQRGNVMQSFVRSNRHVLLGRFLPLGDLEVFRYQTRHARLDAEGAEDVVDLATNLGGAGDIEAVRHGRETVSEDVLLALGGQVASVMG